MTLLPYNVRLIKYRSGGYQLRLYSDIVGVNNYKPIDDKLTLDYLDDKGELHIVRLDSETGRLSLNDDYIFNPFTGEYEKLRTISEAERSQSVSRNRTINNLYYDTRSNVWEWFITLTFSPDKVDRYDFDSCTKKLQNWLIMCRRICPDMKYILVPELHKDGAYHFHGLFADCDGLGFVDSGRKDKTGKTVYNIGKYRLGFTTATRVVSTEKVSKYLTKYITKDLCAATFGKKRYWKSRNLEQAEVVELNMCDADKVCLVQSVQDYIQFQKVVGGDYVRTEYIELESGIDIDFVNKWGEVINNDSSECF